MQQIAVPQLETMRRAVEDLEREGVRVTARELAARTGWSLNCCTYGLTWLGKGAKRGRPPIDHQAVRERVAALIARYLLEQTPLDKDRIAKEIGVSRHAIARALRGLGLRFRTAS